MARELFRSQRERRYWIYAALVLLAIYGSAGVAPQVAAGLRAAGLLAPLFGIAMLLAFAAFIAAGMRWRVNGREAAVLLGILAAYTFLFVRMELAEERSHIIEFGVVALFLREALAERGLARPALVALVLTALAGLLDELLQHLLPNRVFDWRDLGFNLLAALMALAARAGVGWVRDRAQSRRTGARD